jgi:hypothetical protein
MKHQPAAFPKLHQIPRHIWPAARLDKKIVNNAQWSAQVPDILFRLCLIGAWREYLRLPHDLIMEWEEFKLTLTQEGATNGWNQRQDATSSDSSATG